MKGKQTCVLRVTHAVKIKINLLILSGDGRSAMSVDTGEIMRTRPPAVKVPHTDTHTLRNTSSTLASCQRSSCFLHNLCDMHSTEPPLRVSAMNNYETDPQLTKMFSPPSTTGEINSQH